ncbi:MAG: hypothetical protein LBT64_00635, partial [Puniceicoccales bacterium]|nr:hypothetical protein [Puniceicoccales bacterium]
MIEKSWTQIPHKKSIAEALYKALNIGFPLCVVLAQRGISSREEAETFLWPKLSHLEDPFRIANVDSATEILRR